MGKVKKLRSRAATGPTSGKVSHSRDLADAIVPTEDGSVCKQRKSKKRFLQEDSDIVNEKLTKKILESAQKQQDELEEGFQLKPSPSSFKKGDLLKGNASESDDELTEEAEDVKAQQVGDDLYEELQLGEDDLTCLQAFMNPNPPARRTLADIISEKIAEKKTDVSTLMPDLDNPLPELDPKIKEIYTDVKTILQQYRSGKLPKAFKVIPHLKNWEEILYITEPETWSAAAMYQASRIFASNMNQHMAQRFYYLILLPRVRDDIDYYKRLNFHLFMALKKALFKPAAFFKGILLPLCDEGTCTLREAVIVGSILAKCTIPALHASAAMLKIAEMKYSGANSIFLRVLIAKKYALPFRVVDALVHHFLAFQTDRRRLPVLWHLALLAFAEIYRADVSGEQRAKLLELLRHQSHEKITPQIRAQLQDAETRDVEMYADVEMR